MNDLKKVLSKEELTAFTLCALYAENGYEKYRMSKFEEYDLYVRNKDFLVSDSIITFTDTDGKLLALKPDVTLSIIKNSKLQAGETMKVYYNENVYRVSKGTRAYKELMQAGLECLGAVDENSLTEVIALAAKSLDAISGSSVLELSHLSIVDGVLKACRLSECAKAEVLTCLKEKNVAGMDRVVKTYALGQPEQVLLEKLVKTYGSIDSVLPKLDDFCVDKETKDAVESFKTLLNSLKVCGTESKILVDFSVLGNMKYYSGVAFQGYVEGIPTAILSGGEYDKLMSAMEKRGKAVGFAVYLDEVGKV